MKIRAPAPLAALLLLTTSAFAVFDIEPNDTEAEAQSTSTLGPGGVVNDSVAGSVNTPQGAPSSEPIDNVDYYRVPYASGVRSIRLLNFGTWFASTRVSEGGIYGEWRELIVTPSGGLSGKTLDLIATYDYAAYATEFLQLYISLLIKIEEMRADYENQLQNGHNDIPLSLDINRATRIAEDFDRLRELDGQNSDIAQIAADIRAEIDNNPSGSSYFAQLAEYADSMADVADRWHQPRYYEVIGGSAVEIPSVASYSLPIYDTASSSGSGYLSVAGYAGVARGVNFEPGSLQYNLALVVGAVVVDEPPTGTSGDDILVGSDDVDDRIAGLGGNDKISGKGGKDTLDGGLGNDKLDGGTDDDKLLGGSGDDVLKGGPDQDTLDGGPGNDTADYSEKRVPVGVALKAWQRSTVTVAGLPEDVIVNIENVIGGVVDDTMTGDSQPNRLYGRGGDDTLLGQGGRDILNGDAGDDVLKGGPDLDILTGGSGRDLLDGGSGPDRYDFNDPLESRVGARRDVVTFKRTEGDKLDLSTIDADTRGTPGNQAFRLWRGSARFTGTDGELRLGNGILQGDTDGNKIANFEIRILGTILFRDIIP